MKVATIEDFPPGMKRTKKDLIVYKYVRERTTGKSRRGLAQLWIPKGTLYYRSSREDKIRAEHAITLAIGLFKEVGGMTLEAYSRIHSNYVYPHTYAVGKVEKPLFKFSLKHSTCYSGIHFYTADRIFNYGNEDYTVSHLARCFYGSIEQVDKALKMKRLSK